MAFHAITATVKGGQALERHLKEIEHRLGSGAHARVGFLEDATYPAKQKEADADRTYVISGKNTKQRSARNRTAKHSASRGGGALHVAQVAFWNEYGTNGVKGKRKVPSRPFFRTMIADKSPGWGRGLGIALRRTEYDSEAALSIMAEVIAGELRESINNWTSPPNADYTVEKKGFNKPLIDTAVMVRSVDYQVMDGNGDSDE